MTKNDMKYKKVKEDIFLRGKGSDTKKYVTSPKKKIFYVII
jgi:hypothetical protein